MSAKAYSKSPAFEPLCDVPAIELTCRKPPFEPEETIVLNGVFSRLILSKAVVAVLDLRVASPEEDLFPLQQAGLQRVLVSAGWGA